jgi:hypothetical protein
MTIVGSHQISARPSDKSLSKGLVPVACQFRVELTGVLRNLGAGFAWPKVLKSAERGHELRF